MKSVLIICVALVYNNVFAQTISKAWIADNGNGTYKNPIVNADYSDPDAIRVGDDYYMVSSSFTHIPGLPILHSKDLVNWKLIGHALKRQPPFNHFSIVQHGGGVWAPSIRYFNNEFYIYYPDPEDPVPLSGEKRELPVVEVKPVDETTPVFKNFYISNVFCNGAAKGIFIRGLPEMHVKDIVLENMVLKTTKGIDVQEASGISFRNIKIISDETNPVVDILNSDNLSFDNITYKDGSELLFRVSGDRIKNIKIKNTNPAQAKEKLLTEFGADVKEIKW